MKNAQRLGDKFAGTVVVKLGEVELGEAEIEDPEKIADDELKARLSKTKEQIQSSIDALEARVSEAKQQVQPSIALKNKFQAAYEEAIAQAEQLDASAATATAAEQEDAARRNLEKRNEYRRSAERYKTQWEQQKQIVEHHTTLLETLELQTAEIRRNQDGVNAQHENIDAEMHLREMLKEIQAVDALQARVFEAKQQIQTTVGVEEQHEVIWDLKMKSIEIGGKKFQLVSPMTQLYIFLMSFAGNCVRWLLLVYIGSYPAFIMAALTGVGEEDFYIWLIWLIEENFYIGLIIVVWPIIVAILAFLLICDQRRLEKLAEGIIGIIERPIERWNHRDSGTLHSLVVMIGTIIIGLILLPTISIHNIMGIRVLHLNDREPRIFIASVVRCLTGFLQPLDLLWSMGKKRQRLGDKFARTIVVWEPEPAQTEPETEDPAEVLENAIDKMKNRFAAAREKVDAAIEVEKQLQDAYEDAIARSEQQDTRVLTALEGGHKDSDREVFETRNAYRYLAGKYKTQWEEQQQVVQTLRGILQHLQQKMLETEGKIAAVVAQQRNVDAEAHLREILEDAQKNETFETQESTEATALAKAAVELDVAYQDAKLAVEFSGYVEEASIEKELAELKSKLRQ